KLDPPNTDFFVHDGNFGSSWDLDVVRLLAIDAILRELDERAAGADSVLGQIGSYRGATVHRECRTLCHGHDDALLFPLLFDFTHSASLCLAPVIPVPPRAEVAGVSRMTCTSVFAVGKCASTTSNLFAASLGNRPRWLPQLAQRSSVASGPLLACTMAKLVQQPLLRSAFRSSLRRSPCSGDASAS